MKLSTSIFKPTFYIFFFLLSLSTVNAQSIGVSTGIGTIEYFDFEENYDHSFSNYKRGSHQFVKLDFNSMDPELSFFNFTVQLEKSSGSIETENLFASGIAICGVGPFPRFRNSNSMNAKLTTYRMSVGFIPLSINLYKGIRFKSGVQVARTIKTNFYDLPLGKREMSDPIFQSNDIDDLHDMVRKVGVGFIFEIEFGEFNVGKNIKMSPIYNANVSLTQEVDTSFDTRAVRQAFGVSFKWDYKRI